MHLEKERSGSRPDCRSQTFACTATQKFGNFRKQVLFECKHIEALKCVVPLQCLSVLLGSSKSILPTKLRQSHWGLVRECTLTVRETGWRATTQNCAPYLVLLLGRSVVSRGPAPRIYLYIAKACPTFRVRLKADQVGRRR
jgi:hypothetical protein